MQKIFFYCWKKPKIRKVPSSGPNYSGTGRFPPGFGFQDTNRETAKPRHLSPMAAVGRISEGGARVRGVALAAGTRDGPIRLPSFQSRPATFRDELCCTFYVIAVGLICQSWALPVFFNFFNSKHWIFAFFIKLIWLGGGFLNRTALVQK